MSTKNLKVEAAKASPTVPTKVTLDGAVWDLSNLTSPSSDPYRRFYYIKDRTPSPTGRSSRGSSTTDSYDGSLESDEANTGREDHQRRRRVRFQDLVDDKGEDLFYPKLRDIPSSLDIDDIFAKLSASKMLRSGRPANPGLPSSLAPLSSSGMCSRKEEEAAIELSPRSTATPRGGDGSHGYRINSSILSPGGLTRLTVDLDEILSPVSQQLPQRPYFGLDSPPPSSSSRATVSGSTRGGESGDSRQRRGGGGGRDPRYNDRNPRSSQQQQQQHHRNQLYYDQQDSNGRRMPPPQRGGRGEDYYGGRDEYSYRRDQQQQQEHRNSRDRYNDREDFRRQNTRTYYDEYQYVDEFDGDGRPRSLSPAEGRSGSYYEDDRQQQRYLDYEEQGYDSYSYSSRQENEELCRQAGPPLSLSDTRTMVEVVPGEFVPLRGSGETWQAIQAGRVMTTSCSCCFLKLLVLEHVDLVMCPGCRVICPVNEGRGGGGLGLGMSVEDARKELDRRR